MRLLLLGLISVSTVAIAIEPAHAQATDQIIVDVPFDFVVGNSTLRAGVYEVQEQQSGILTLTSHDGQQRRFTFTIPGQSTNGNHQPEAVFVRYGSESFLSKVFLSGDNECLVLPRSSREKVLIQRKASGEEVSLLIQPRALTR
jgi:hypothetical protein